MCILSDHERLFLILIILGFYFIDYDLELFACILLRQFIIILSACCLVSFIFQRLISTKVIDF